MRTDDFDYSLPSELIAQAPVEPRDHSRLLVVERSSGTISHCRFYDLRDLFRPGDLLVANESRVMPARLIGYKIPTRGRVEVLLLRPIVEPGGGGEEPVLWEALVSPGRRLPDGALIGFGTPESGTYMEATAESRLELGARLLRFSTAPRPLLESLGQVPLPPYIHETLADPDRYQTVYARTDGSAAAPTAGLHFTEDLIEGLQVKGIGFATVTLHVGLDTFRPVHEENIADHPMHKEWYMLPEATALALTETRKRGGRVVAVGTTSVRVLETAARTQGLSLDQRDAPVDSSEGWTDLFISPGYRFGLVDAMITNFHLPRTTLLMLVSAFAGRDLVLQAYETAIREKYRFYSFGDAMLIL
ncbi:MAG TPA: tRNA preQ1(34) S-adenosylmethionine ribosyltransferase-isomerase QueA [Chloroflexia bacterium]|nr:tRNA preQ1(34) S-adenosylmethionine ribosyltransferase-isomerase QueA [Chloroflexia bacterium]